MHHRVIAITPQLDFILKSTFADGQARLYDIKALAARHEVFQDLLRTRQLFEQVKIDAGGYGVTWNDYLDLDAQELWIHGQEL